MKKVIPMLWFVPFMAFGNVIINSEGDKLKTSLSVKPGSIVITEIMADPVPAVDLPPEEYIEIHNRSGDIIDLREWKLSSGDQHSDFPEVKIYPGDYLILCAVTDTAFFSSYGLTLGLKPFPALTDKGRMIVLSDDNGKLVNGVEYSSDWYDSPLKSGGGWSLEIIDLNFPFFAEGNWTASASGKGGTPGSENSSNRSNPDRDFRGIVNVFPRDSLKIFIGFSESVPDFMDHVSEMTIDEYFITAAGLTDPLYRSFVVSIEKPLLRGKVFTLFLPEEVKDFAGNIPSKRSFCFGLAEVPCKRDIVFNELMFNPLPENPDFIEFFNLSEKTIDASELSIASVNTQNGKISEARQISSEQRCIIPGSYYTITTDRLKVISDYPSSSPDNIFSVVSLPSMPDDRGHLLLLNRHLDNIDEVLYNEEMHYSLLSGHEGISLEKIRPDLPSYESRNWHSASESSGWATPGTINSVVIDDPVPDGKIVLSSSLISPDNDGFEDVLLIDLLSGDQGSIITVTVFDENGSPVRKITENYLAGSKASLVWDGTADDGRIVDQGIYIILIELYNDKGRREKWKKVCAVLRR